jgi:hypothetical protein
MALVIKDAGGNVINIGAWDDLGGTNPLPAGAVVADISAAEVIQTIARAERPTPAQRAALKATIQTLIGQGKTAEALTKIMDLV